MIFEESMVKTPRLKICLLAILLAAVVLWSMGRGSMDVSLMDLFRPENQPLLSLRFFRVMLAVLIGAGLGVCGVALQAILRNPLAEPYLLGTSSGAGLGAVLAIIGGLGGLALPFVAFGGAWVSVILVYYLASEGGRIPVPSLILSGVIVAISLSGIMMFLISTSSNQALHGVIWWLLGSLQVYDPRLLFFVAALVISGGILIFILAQDLNAISIGEEEATHLGISVENIKKVLFVITALITGALVSVSGMISFVGLIIPHMMRLIVGPNHKVLVPATFLGGAAFLVLCDTFARTVLSPVEIPIGVVTSLIGAPVFMVLLKRSQRV
jgi:iron complex transport system permease protein